MGDKYNLMNIVDIIPGNELIYISAEGSPATIFSYTVRVVFLDEIGGPNSIGNSLMSNEKIMSIRA